jgi:hypothetical protein
MVELAEGQGVVSATIARQSISVSVIAWRHVASVTLIRRPVQARLVGALAGEGARTRQDALHGRPSRPRHTD